MRVSYYTTTPRTTISTGDVLDDLFGGPDVRDDSTMVRRSGRLTCDHAASSHGLPVLVADDGSALGSAEVDGVYYTDDDFDAAMIEAGRRAGYAMQAAHAD